MNEMSLSQRERLSADLRHLVTDAEELLRLTASQTGEGAAEVRAQADALLARAKAGLVQLQQAGVAKARAAGHAADVYVHENPWRSMGAVAGLALVTGLLIGRR